MSCKKHLVTHICEIRSIAVGVLGLLVFGVSAARAQQAPVKAQQQQVEGAQAAVEFPVLMVNRVELLRFSGESGGVVRVQGLATGAASGTARLVPTFFGEPSDGILDLILISSVSGERSADIKEVQGTFFFGGAIGSVNGVRVRSAMNVLASTDGVVGAQVAWAHVDISKWVGKTLTEAVSELSSLGYPTEHPGHLRIIKPSDSALDFTIKPTRLSIFVDSDEAVIQIVWQ